MEHMLSIRPASKRNGLTYGIGGVIGGITSIIWFSEYAVGSHLVGSILICITILLLTISAFKLTEPVSSLQLTANELHYIHRHGNWRIEWSNVQRIDVPKVDAGLHHKPLNVIGIKLKSYDALLDNISPRLASNLLVQQRVLLACQNTNDVETWRGYAQHLVEDNTFTAVSGKKYTGIQAMLGNRMTTLRGLLGYDLYIDEADIDRPVADFVRLLRDCQQTSIAT